MNKRDAVLQVGRGRFFFIFVAGACPERACGVRF